VRRSFALAAIGLALALGACQRGPEVAPRASAPAVDHVAEARQAIAAEQWAVAAEHLRAAVLQDPRSLYGHYSLAVCATWLDLKDEAAREFEWVVANAPTESEEAKLAKRWLADNRGRTVAQPSTDDPKRGDSGLHGVVTWAEPGQSPTRQSHQRLILIGVREGRPTSDLVYVKRADQEGRYEFKNIVAGLYRLSGDAPEGPGGWRLKVELKPQEDLALDLTPGNSTSVRNDFPDNK
jgi:hypothetical protein